MPFPVLALPLNKKDPSHVFDEPTLFERIRNSALHAKRLPRPSQTYDENCADRGAAWFTIHVWRSTVRSTEVKIQFHAPKHHGHLWPEYVDTFQRIINAGMNALFEYAYTYGMVHSNLALEIQEESSDDWTTDVDEKIARSDGPGYYRYGKWCEFVNFHDGLFLPEQLPGGKKRQVPKEFQNMCGVVIDRMCTGACKVMQKPVYGRDIKDFEFGISEEDLDEDFTPERLTCKVLLCAAKNLGYTHHDLAATP